jgi:predicted nuclease of predicted toxin-antitoxin system|tara:strand:+ start:840 stop:1178 length:339 start_codon:yes stop_codon:yes gene_type:complete
VKFLFDQNLSRRLIGKLSESFPDSVHVAHVELDRADDEVVWSYARDNGFTILSKDTDFLGISVLRGAPPKVIYLEVGNCTTDLIHKMIQSSVDEIREFDSSVADTILILSRD